MRGPSERQLKALSFVASHIDTNGRPPTLREMMAAFGWVSTNAASDVLKSLAQKSLIERTAGLSRAVRVTKAGYAALGLVGPLEVAVDRYVVHELEKARAWLRVS